MTQRNGSEYPGPQVKNRRIQVPEDRIRESRAQRSGLENPGSRGQDQRIQGPEDCIIANLLIRDQRLVGGIFLSILSKSRPYNIFFAVIYIFIYMLGIAGQTADIFLDKFSVPRE